jgi:DNA-directed RNA polymerase specialized sigma24 family protein
MYEEVEGIRHQLWVLVRYADLNLSLRQMPPKEYQAVLLVGLLGLDTRWAGKELGVSHDTMWRRYQRGLDWLTNHMNRSCT